MTQHNTPPLHPTYVKLATTLKLGLVYPILLVAVVGVMALLTYDALFYFGLFTLALVQFAMAYIINLGMSNTNPFASKVFEVFVLAEIPHHNDGKAGLAYFFIFIMLGAALTAAQLVYWLYLLVF